MAITCARDLTILPAFELTAYWPFEEVYDGVSAAVVSASTATMRTVTQGLIGITTIGGTGSGAVDELGLSVQDVLSASQVAALYNAGAGLTWPAVDNI